MSSGAGKGASAEPASKLVSLSETDSAPKSAPKTGLRLRVLSALVLAPLVLIVTLIGDWPFAVTVALAGLVMAYEWSRLIDGNGLTIESGLHGGVILLVAMLSQFDAAGLALIATFFGTVTAMGLAKERKHATLWPMLGTPYVAIPVISLIWLRGQDDAGLRHMIWLLALVWATDTAAYAAGRSLGGPKLAPAISPAKTWSGLLGGIFAAGLIGAVAAKLTGRPDMTEFVILSAVLAAWAEIGDLAESALKRRFEIKDTGTLIPGHGGMLDRLDSLLFAAPLAALWLVIRGEGALP
jgi:phosphatidate cytidylyltransferase